MWDLWRILTIDGRPQIAVTLNSVDKTLLFTTTSVINGSQVVTFADPQVKVNMLGYDDGIHEETLLGLCVLRKESDNLNMTEKIVTSYFNVVLGKENCFLIHMELRGGEN